MAACLDDIRITGQSHLVWRRVFHFTAGSSVSLLGAFLPQVVMVWSLAALVTGGLGLELARIRIERLNRVFLRWMEPLLKDSEDRRVTGATYMVIAALAVFLLFDRPVAVAALLFLSVGDPVAALVGRRTPGRRIFGKSPGGTGAFIVISWAIVEVMVGAGFSDHRWGLMAGAVAAALTELVPLPVDDNLTVPLVAAVVMYISGV